MRLACNLARVFCVDAWARQAMICIDPAPSYLRGFFFRRAAAYQQERWITEIPRVGSRRANLRLSGQSARFIKGRRDRSVADRSRVTEITNCFYSGETLRGLVLALHDWAM